MNLKNGHFRLIIDVADDKVVTQIPSFNLSAEVVLRAQTMIAQFESILNAPLPLDKNLPDLSADYLARLEAIELRAQIRQEQGRSV